MKSPAPLSDAPPLRSSPPGRGDELVVGGVQDVGRAPAHEPGDLKGHDALFESRGRRGFRDEVSDESIGDDAGRRCEGEFGVGGSHDGFFSERELRGCRSRQKVPCQSWHNQEKCPATKALGPHPWGNRAIADVAHGGAPLRLVATTKGDYHRESCDTPARF